MKKTLLAVAMLSMSLFLMSCGNSSTNSDQTSGSQTEATTQANTESTKQTNTESTKQTSTEAATETNTEVATETTTELTPEATTEAVSTISDANSEKMDVTNVDFDELSDISNKSSEYGFSNKWRDDLNRPEDLADYDDKYAKYSAYNHIDTEEKVIYLTMDEGYENGYTPDILDTLKEKGVNVTFFVTEQFYDEHPELIQRMIDEGHHIGNHTCSHPASGMPSLGLKKEYKDIKKLNDEIYDTFGYQMRLFRFPQGNASKQSCALLQQMGYSSVFWSFAYADYDPDDQMDPSDALDQCLEYIHPGGIYLLHAISKTNCKILGDFIDGAREKGYEFGDVQEAILGEQ